TASSSEAPRAGRPPDDPGFRHFFASIKGESHTNPDGSSRQEILGRCRAGERLRLEREPDNPVDPNAIKVCRLTGEQLGYVAADVAERLAEELDRGAVRVPILASVGRTSARTPLGGVLLIVAVRHGMEADKDAVTAYAKAVLAADRRSP